MPAWPTCGGWPQKVTRVRARFLKGLLLLQAGDSRNASRVFSALTEDYPRFPQPYNNLAAIQAAEGDYDAAERTLRRALDASPGYVKGLENLGDLYLKMAADAYQRALALDPQADGVPDKADAVARLFGAEAP